MERILNLTHNDMDGVAAAIAIKTAHPLDHVKTEFVTYDNVHDTLKEACEAKTPWDRIILSDISIRIPEKDAVYTNDKQAKLVQELPEIIRSYVDNGGRFVVLDHHGTAVPMRLVYGSLLDEDSILQVSDEDGVLRAGSELAARYMVRKLQYLEAPLYSIEVIRVLHDEDCGDHDEDEEDGGPFKVLQYDIFEYAERVFEFCTLAGDYDVWRDPFGFGGRMALALGLMDDNHGALREFEELIRVATATESELEHIIDSFQFSYYLNMADNMLSGALRTTDREKIKLHDRLYQITPPRFPSHCAMHVYDQTKGVVILVYPNNPRKVSFRRHPECKVNLGEFCRKFGGGGHTAAAGLTIPENVTVEEVIEEMKKELDKLLD